MKKQVIFNIFNANNNPLNTLLDERLNALTSLSIVELIEQLEKEYKNIDKVRVKLVKDIFWLDDKGQVKDVKNQEKIQEFNKEFNTILEQDIDIKHIEVKAEWIKITPKDILLLKEFIKFTK